MQHISNKILFGVTVVFQVAKTGVVGILLDLVFGHSLVGNSQVPEKGIGDLEPFLDHERIHQGSDNVDCHSIKSFCLIFRRGLLMLVIKGFLGEHNLGWR